MARFEEEQMGLEEEIAQNGRGSGPDLSNEGLDKLADKTDEETEDTEEVAEVEESNVDNEAEEEGDQVAESSESEETPKEEQGEQEKEDDEEVLTEDGIRSIEDALDMHKKDQKYISELQQERAELKKMMQPFVSKDDEGNFKVDKSKLTKQVSDDAGPTQEQKSQAIDAFWGDFDKDPLQAIGNVVATMQKGMLEPYERDRVQRKRKSTIDALHEDKYSKYGDLRDAVENLVNNNDALRSMGPEGIELAYKSVIGDAMPSIVKNLEKDKKEKSKNKTAPSAPTGRNTDTKSKEKKSASDEIRDSIFGAIEKDKYF